MYQIPEWDEFQQYKDRRPTWIKFHRSLLDNRAFQKLPISARAMLPMIWLLASEHKDASSGLIELSAEDISYRLRIPEVEVEENLEILITSGFINDVRNCTDLYGTVLRGETETYRKETEENPNPKGDFTAFWSAYPSKVGKDKAKVKYQAALKRASHEEIMVGLANYLKSKVVADGFIKNPTTWLNGGHWQDEYGGSKKEVPAWVKAQR